MCGVNQKRLIRTPAFTAWLDSLTDQVGKGAVLERIDRLKLGLYGDSKSVKGAPGLFELRIDVGPGYRVYYTEAGGMIILLVLGGDKRTQTADIKAAKASVAVMVAQQQAAKKKKAEEDKKAAKLAEKASRKSTTSKRK